MTKPEISPEKMAEYEQLAEESFTVPGVPEWIAQSTGQQREFFKQLYIAGDWLKDQLIENGATEEQAEQQSFAFGQRCFGREPWSVAQEQLQKWLTQKIDQPGEQLADEIISEHAGTALQIIAEQFTDTALGDFAEKQILYKKFTRFWDDEQNVQI